MTSKYTPEPLPEPAIKGVFEKEYKTIHKGDEYYSAEQVMKLCRMWANLHDTAKKNTDALGKAAYRAFVALENIAAHDYALVGQPTPVTIAEAIAVLKAAGITHSTKQE